MMGNLDSTLTGRSRERSAAQASSTRPSIPVHRPPFVTAVNGTTPLHVPVLTAAARPVPSRMTLPVATCTTTTHPCPPKPSKPPAEDMAPTKLRLVDIPSHAYFSRGLAQSSEDQALGIDSTFEFVVADHRLQYMELLKLDGSVEIEFVSLGDDDTFLGVPTSCSNLSWKVSPGGWVRVPKEIDGDAHRVSLSNRWWAGLKQCLNPSLHGLMRYDLFEKRFLRLFITPVTGEECVRAIVTTNTPVVMEDLSETRGNSHGGALLSECIIVRPPGEFPATIDDLFDGSQLVHQKEVYHDPELVSIVPPCGPSDPSHSGTCAKDFSKVPLILEPASSAATVVACNVAMATQPASIVAMSATWVPEVATAASIVTMSATCVPEVATAASIVTMSATCVPEVATAASIVTMSATCGPEVSTAASVAAEDEPPLAIEKGSTESWGSPGFARPLPMLVRQTSTKVPMPGTHLFPHQQRTVSWMLDVESGKCAPLLVPQSVLFGESHAYHRGIWYDIRHGFPEAMMSENVECLCADGPFLAYGGLVAHPVGSGKTVIAAEVISRTLHMGITAVYVPGHIARQWRSELVRFVPNVKVLIIMDESQLVTPQSMAAANVLIIPHNLAAIEHNDGFLPYRIVIDEPQEVIKSPRLFEALVQNGCRRRWLLTATPTPLGSMMQLALGINTASARSLPYDSMLLWFSRSRCRRDPPFLCLPVPPLHVHMHPVTLQWQEMSVLHSYTMQDDLQSAIRLASFFHLVQRGRGNTDGGLHGAQMFVSMDEWVHQHRNALVEGLTEARAMLSSLVKQVTTERCVYVEELKRRRDAEAAVAGSDGSVEQAQDNMHIADMMDSDSAGVSMVLLQHWNSARKTVSTLEKRLAFLQTVTDSITCEAECVICMNTLGNRVVSIMPCLHSVCAACASELFQRQQSALCPLCRMSILRRDVCTFVCSANNAGVCVCVWGVHTYSQCRI